MTMREYWAQLRKKWNAMPGRRLISFDVFMWSLIGSLPSEIAGIVLGNRLVALLPVALMLTLYVTVAVGIYLPED